MSTRAIKFLKQRKVSFKVIKYRHDEKGAEFASKATGFALEQTIKTLVVNLGNQKYCLTLLPGSRQLDPKALARIFSVKRTSMAEISTAEKLTGYMVGGISPFGTKKSFPVVMEASIVNYEKIHINAGQRGAMLEMDPADIVRVLKCEVAEIASL
jgi:Cys-tRNA(Pro)/Cys-tRNA(Cys) deacylase